MNYNSWEEKHLLHNPLETAPKYRRCVPSFSDTSCLLSLSSSKFYRLWMAPPTQFTQGKTLAVTLDNSTFASTFHQRADLHFQVEGMQLDLRNHSCSWENDFSLCVPRPKCHQDANSALSILADTSLNSLFKGKGTILQQQRTEP